MGRIAQIDRRAGAAVRDAVARLPGGPAIARAGAAALSPAFRGMVAAMILRPSTRRMGIDALAAGVAAGLGARVLRDRLGRPRPGPREEGGFPSRHAAASVAIAGAVRRHRPGLGAVLGVAAAACLTARVASAQHEPADIAAGAALGGVAHRLVRLPGQRIALPR
ncbi:MAG: hypothetical protein AB7V42_04930 [Thermoleophilia bacterium]